MLVLEPIKSGALTPHQYLCLIWGRRQAKATGRCRLALIRGGISRPGFRRSPAGRASGGGQRVGPAEGTLACRRAPQGRLWGALLAGLRGVWETIQGSKAAKAPPCAEVGAQKWLPLRFLSKCPENCSSRKYRCDASRAGPSGFASDLGRVVSVVCGRAAFGAILWFRLRPGGAGGCG